MPEPTIHVEPYVRNASVGENVTYRVVASNVSQGIRIFRLTAEMCDPSVASASVDRVAVDGQSAETVLQQADTGGVVVTLGDSSIDAGETVTVEYTLSVSEDAELGASYDINGTVVSGETTSLPIDRVTVREQGPVAQYDEDGDGGIDITTLGELAATYAAS